MIPIKCNVHSWMHAYIGVVDNPYFAVTGPDGTFEWKNVPPGDYTIGVWHEKLGEQERPRACCTIGSRRCRLHLSLAGMIEPGERILRAMTNSGKLAVSVLTGRHGDRSAAMPLRALRTASM